MGTKTATKKDDIVNFCSDFATKHSHCLGGINTIVTTVDEVNTRNSDEVEEFDFDKQGKGK